LISISTLHFYEKTHLLYVELSETYSFTRLGKSSGPNVFTIVPSLVSLWRAIFEEMQLKLCEYIG
jgi:hypothetical protein